MIGLRNQVRLYRVLSYFYAYVIVGASLLVLLRGAEARGVHLLAVDAGLAALFRISCARADAHAAGAATMIGLQGFRVVILVVVVGFFGVLPSVGGQVHVNVGVAL